MPSIEDITPASAYGEQRDYATHDAQRASGAYGALGAAPTQKEDDPYDFGGVSCSPPRCGTSHSQAAFEEAMRAPDCTFGQADEPSAPAPAPAAPAAPVKTPAASPNRLPPPDFYGFAVDPPIEQYTGEYYPEYAPPPPPAPRAAKVVPPALNTDYFASRAEAASALLRRTTYNSGAKFFASGAITVHVSELTLFGAEKLPPSSSRMEVCLLGQPVHQFDVSTSGAEAPPPGSQRPSELVLRPEQAIAYEVVPEQLALHLARSPYCEFKLYCGEQLLGVAAVDLAAMHKNLNGATLTLERVAPPTAAASNAADASAAVGRVVCSIRAEGRSPTGAPQPPPSSARRSPPRAPPPTPGVMTAGAYAPPSNTNTLPHAPPADVYRPRTASRPASAKGGGGRSPQRPPDSPQQAELMERAARLRAEAEEVEAELEAAQGARHAAHQQAYGQQAYGHGAEEYAPPYGYEPYGYEPPPTRHHYANPPQNLQQHGYTTSLQQHGYTTPREMQQRGGAQGGSKVWRPAGTGPTPPPPPLGASRGSGPPSARGAHPASARGAGPRGASRGGSRPASATASRVGGFGSSCGGGGFGGASAISAAGSHAGSVCGDAAGPQPVGFQYNAIPARCLTPHTLSSASLGIRSAVASSLRGFGHGPDGRHGRSASRLASGDGGGGGGHAINSHALAEGFWSAWRQKQLPVGRPAPGEVVVVVECRYDTSKGMTTKHDPAKYEMYAARVRSIVQSQLGSLGDVIVVPDERHAAEQAAGTASWQTAHGPRLGAFEVEIFSVEGGEVVSDLLHSKLLSKKWPSSKKLENALRGQTKTIVVRPVVRCEDGSEFPIRSLPPLRLRAGTGPGSSYMPTDVVRAGAGESASEALMCQISFGAEGMLLVLEEGHADFEPLERPVGSLHEGADGTCDVAAHLTPKPRAFELTIEFVKPPPDEKTRVGAPTVTLRACGRRAPDCDLPHTPWEVTGERGVHVLTWNGHVERLQIEGGGPAGQIVSTWPQWGEKAPSKNKDGKHLLPRWTVTVDVKGAPTAVQSRIPAVPAGKAEPEASPPRPKSPPRDPRAPPPPVARPINLKTSDKWGSATAVAAPPPEDEAHLYRETREAPRSAAETAELYRQQQEPVREPEPTIPPRGGRAGAPASPYAPPAARGGGAGGYEDLYSIDHEDDGYEGD